MNNNNKEESVRTNTHISCSPEHILNNKIKTYIEENIFPKYEANDSGHGLKHINYVIRRSLCFAKQLDNINYNLVYVVAALHDLGHYLNPKEHEKVAAQLFLEDDFLKSFFTIEEQKIIEEAILDHRASSNQKPRSIYGQIVSSADRSTSYQETLKRTYAYRVKNNPEITLEEIMEESRNHIIDKYGNNGYATDKMYFKDEEYERFLKEINLLINNKENFEKEYLKINNLTKAKNNKGRR